MSSGIASLLTAAGALFAVLLLIAGGARLMRTSGWVRQTQTGMTLTVRESVALDPKRRLHLVQCGGRQVLLLTGGAQDVVVGWVEPGP
jgi:flagellar protein FliO/FliZ